MKKILVLAGLFSIIATLPAASCKKKEKPAKVIKAKHDSKETAGYLNLRA